MFQEKKEKAPCEAAHHQFVRRPEKNEPIFFRRQDHHAPDEKQSKKKKRKKEVCVRPFFQFLSRKSYSSLFDVCRE